HIISERNAGADANIEDAPADALGGRDRGLAAGVEPRAEHEIVDRRPARVSLRNRVDIDFARHRPHANSRHAARIKRCGETHIWLAPQATRVSPTSGTRGAPAPPWINTPPQPR